MAVYRPQAGVDYETVDIFRRADPDVILSQAQSFISWGKPYSALRCWSFLMERPDIASWARVNGLAVAANCGAIETAVGLSAQLVDDPAAESYWRTAWDVHALWADASGNYDTPTAFEWGRRYERYNSEAIEPMTPMRRSRSAGEPIRIGYTWSYFQNATVFDMLEHHDRGRFEVIALDAGTGTADTKADRTVRIGHLDSETAAASIAAEDLDILIELDGRGAGKFRDILNRRPSFQRVGYLNVMLSTGGLALDAIICDSNSISETEPHYAERMVPVSEFVMPLRADPKPILEVPFRARPVLGAISNRFKITSHTIDRWAHLLNAIPGADFCYGEYALEEEAADHIAGMFAERGVPANRLFAFAGGADFSFAGLLASIDVAIDSTPYSSHLTTMEALASGVPVLTIEGERYASRLTGSILRRVGLADFVCRDLDELAQRAADLLRDRAGLAALRRDLPRRISQSKVWDPVYATRVFEEAAMRLVD